MDLRNFMIWNKHTHTHHIII